jgi:UDP-N-acetyl-D-glucosamine dehydrogenase
VRALLEAGHAADDIAVVCWHGLASSRIAGADEIAGLRTRRFTGRYDDAGRPLFTDGALQLETLFRFKGQAADCVVITTNHKVYDYPAILDAARLVVDTRNALGKLGKNNPKVARL